MKITRILSFALAATLTSSLLFSCSNGKDPEKISKVELKKGPHKTISLYTHMGNRVNGEEKTDADGNTYIDKSYAILTHLAEKFEEQTNIHVELVVVTNEDDIRDRLKQRDPEIDIYTCPNWTATEWKQLAEPYYTLDEARKLYGDYADTMYNDGKNVFAMMPAISYNSVVVYNEETIKKAGYDSIPTIQVEFEKMCDALREKKINPIALHRVENWPLSTINDFANYVDGTNNVFASMLKLSDPFSYTQPMGKTIKMYTKWKSRGYFELEPFTDFGDAMNSIADGRSAMMLFGAWVAPQIQGRLPEGTDPNVIKLAPCPDFGKGRFVMACAADNYAISKGSDDKEAARLFLDYLSEDAQYLADSGYIANKKGVTPIVPDIYKLINDEVEAGTCKVLYIHPTDLNFTNNEAVLKAMGLLQDNKYAGNLFDSVDVDYQPDWTEYDKLVEKQNQDYAITRDMLNIKWLSDAELAAAEAETETSAKTDASKSK